MHRLSLRIKVRNLRLSELEMRFRQRRNRTRLVRRSHQTRAWRVHLVNVVVPSILQDRVDERREELFDFLDTAEAALEQGCPIRLDLKGVKELHPCGTLIFLARLDVWLELYPGRISCNYPDDEVVEQLLQHVNVISRLGLQERTQITHERVRFWHFHSGLEVDATAYRQLATTVRDNIDHPQAGLFADCLNEAVTNSVNHAYKFERPWLPPKSQRKWWVLSLLREQNVFVAIYDAGVTIPGSLRRKPEFNDYFGSVKLKDARVIDAAARTGRTSTELKHRGKGLPEMLEFSENLKSGGLSIASGKGIFMYNAETRAARRMHYARAMPGTLVLWTIPFREERNDERNDQDS